MHDVDRVTVIAHAFAGVDGTLRAVRRFRKGSAHTAKEVVSVPLNAGAKWLLDVIWPVKRRKSGWRSTWLA